MRLQLETEIKMGDNHFTKVDVCEHVSAHVFITKTNQTLTIKCKYCGIKMSEWINERTKEIVRKTLNKNV